MPLVSLNCQACGHTYDAIKGQTIADPDADACPKCHGSDLIQQITGGGLYAKGYDYSDPDILAMTKQNNDWIEARSEQVLSGEIQIREPKGMPAHLRPQCPDYLKKSYR
jgi:putative FmdB family regulatory protein